MNNKRVNWTEVRNAPRKQWRRRSGSVVVGRELQYHDGRDFRFHLIETDDGKRHLVLE